MELPVCAHSTPSVVERGHSSGPERRVRAGGDLEVG